LPGVPCAAIAVAVSILVVTTGHRGLVWCAGVWCVVERSMCGKQRERLKLWLAL
jgi:hypothetical protein